MYCFFRLSLDINAQVFYSFVSRSHVRDLNWRRTEFLLFHFSLFWNGMKWWDHWCIDESNSALKSQASESSYGLRSCRAAVIAVTDTFNFESSIGANFNFVSVTLARLLKFAICCISFVSIRISSHYNYNCFCYFSAHLPFLSEYVLYSLCLINVPYSRNWV